MTATTRPALPRNAIEARHWVGATTPENLVAAYLFLIEENKACSKTRREFNNRLLPKILGAARWRGITLPAVP